MEYEEETVETVRNFNSPKMFGNQQIGVGGKLHKGNHNEGQWDMKKKQRKQKEISIPQKCLGISRLGLRGKLYKRNYNEVQWNMKKKQWKQ